MAAGRLVVIGGGIAGSFAAYFLARADVEVTLIERDEIGVHASGNNPGGLNPLYGAGIPGPLQDLALEAFHLHLDLWHEIGRLSQLDFAARRNKRLNLAFEDADFALLERMKENYDAHTGFSARWVERDELLEIEPRLHPDVARGLWAEGDAKVDGAAYTRAVARAAQERGAAVVTGDVDGLETRDDRVTGVHVGSELMPCDGVVIATGPWCGRPARWLERSLPVEPVKGEMLLVELDGGVLPTDLAWRDVGVYQAAADQVWLGGTEDHVGFDREISEAARASIVERAGRVMPAMVNARVLHQTAGLRPVTPDGMPVVGASDGWSNVWVALGGGRKGMLFSAAMGAAIADLVTAGSTKLSVEPCSGERFAVEATAVDVG